LGALILAEVFVKRAEPYDELTPGRAERECLRPLPVIDALDRGNLLAEVRAQQARDSG